MRAATIVAAVALTGMLVLAAPLAASAHVHLHPERATAGADETMLTFEVPNESATRIRTVCVTPSYEPVRWPTVPLANCMLIEAFDQTWRWLARFRKAWTRTTSPQK